MRMRMTRERVMRTRSKIVERARGASVCAAAMTQIDQPRIKAVKFAASTMNAARARPACQSYGPRTDAVDERETSGRLRLTHERY